MPLRWLTRLLHRSAGPTVLDPDDLDRSALEPWPEGGVLVGGAVRDLLLGRELRDLDWLVPDPARAAQAAAAALGGSVFVLDPERDHWRVALGADPERNETARMPLRDYAPRTGELEPELRRRDFTVNALALPRSGPLVDPSGGLADLRAGRLRLTGPGVLETDPLRLLRALRLCAELGFELEAGTRAAVRAGAAAVASGAWPHPAWERIRDELDRTLLTPRPGPALRLADALGLLDAFLPELAEGRGVEQGGLHHLDVLDHQLEALHRLATGFPEADLTLRWATLLHDVGKPATREVGDDGRTRFYGHARSGARITQALLQRLRQPRDRIERAAALVRYHMLQLPRDERQARRFTHRRRELLPDLLQLMIADREAARGPLASEAGRRAYRVALGRVLAILDEAPPEPPLLDGREVMTLLGLDPGPRVGEAVRLLAEAQAIGDVTDRTQAEAALLRYAAAQGWLGTDRDGAHDDPDADRDDEEIADD